MSKNIPFYLVANIINALVPLMLLPVMTRYFPDVDIGKFAIWLVLNSVFIILTGGGVISAAERKFFDIHDEDSNKLAYFNGECVLSIALFSIILAAVFALLGKYIVAYVELKPIYIYCSLLSAACTNIIQFRLSQWQIKGKSQNYLALVVSMGLLNIFLTLFMVFILDLFLSSRVFSVTITNLILSSASVYLLIRDGSLKIRLSAFAHYRELFFYVANLFPHMIASVFVVSIDRVMVNHILGPSSTGIYYAAVSLAGTLSLIFHAVNKAYTPWLFSWLKKNDYEVDRKIVGINYTMIIALLFIGLIAAIAIPYMAGIILGERYAASASLIRTLILGQVFLGAYLIFTNYLFYERRVLLISIATLSSTTLSILLLYMFLLKWGLPGAALANVCGYLMLLSVTVLMTLKVKKMPWFKPKLKAVML